MRTLRWVSWLTAASAYFLIVLGAMVRITGSGMGCGDDWPLCHGRLVPPLDDLPTLIEWSHRLAAAGLSTLVAILASLAWLWRSQPGVGGSGGVLRPSLLAAGLLLVQVLLGAVTVWLELPPPVVTVHWATALSLLAAVLVAAFRAGTRAPSAAASRPAERSVEAAVALAALTLLLGGLTASTNAGFACLGFPLCSGRWLPPTQTGLAAIQWVHRLAAYGLVLHLVGLALRWARQDAPGLLARWGWIVLALAVAQGAVAVVMVSRSLPLAWRGLHAALGTALWAALVRLALLVRPARQRAA